MPLAFAPPSPSSQQSPSVSIFLSAVLGLLLGLILRPFPRSDPSPLPTTSTSRASFDPSYRPSPPPKTCPPPPNFRPRSTLLHAPCLTLVTPTATSFLLRLHLSDPQLPPPYSIDISPTYCPPSHPPINLSLPSLHASLRITNLSPDLDYTLQIRASSRHSPLCRVILSTLPDSTNLAQNPSFEQVAVPVPLATRYAHLHDSPPRHWTPFYNGHARRACGLYTLQNALYYPLHGDCMLALGGHQLWKTEVQLHHGVHQGLWVGRHQRNLVVGAWYRVAGATEGGIEEEDSMAGEMIVGGERDDGVIVPLHVGGNGWKRVCVVVEARRWLHVWFHWPDVEDSALLVDEVEVRDVTKVDDLAACFVDDNGGNESNSGTREEEESRLPAPRMQLCADSSPHDRELTIAVPLTADRVLRLESMARLYGGGPIVAAVAVRNMVELEMFRKIWEGKLWLRRHVSVTFVRWREGEAALPINALRNIAVLSARTDFVMMADVDMTPAWKSFACLRAESGAWLRQLLPEGERRVLTPPVFIGDVQHRPAADKEELRNLLSRRVGTAYCLNSQRSNKVKRWYSERNVVETRFLTDYEPYGIIRRDMYPAYDERFNGYGFNKISWAFGAELSGWRIFVLPEAFLTHLNHVENDWVQSIDVEHYLQTWRRFQAFAIERSSFRGLESDIIPARNISGATCNAALKEKT
eukprot:GFKZ01009223.1.p1 GENE.GFKZ01009223.1~~GFKZ01009223.1.p1  ORF type:complete len:695 (-),score=79.17 GFKZ01009223.1:34-2118(-)